MPGARRSLASPVVSGVLCPCGSPHAPPAEGGGSGGSSSNSSSSSSSGGSCGRSLCEASEQDRRLRALFQKLDVNRDGALCVHDLAVGLGRLGLQRSELDLLDSQASCHRRLLSPVTGVLAKSQRSDQPSCFSALNPGFGSCKQLQLEGWLSPIEAEVGKAVLLWLRCS
ncbi:calcium-binding mitochondrial carrier protein SCaMC-2-like isoform X2 [Pitangus sulphuratus]|nr:calcium-binding mitochondrial carrier protein SCaMC-2-like isoform X2 [Pitangus sulphuratus]